MSMTRTLLLVAVLLCVGQGVRAADIILNEYNAVGAKDFLNGGDSAADSEEGRAFDSYFGRIQGNGGDWFELVVIKDHLDMRKWKFDVYENGKLDETLDLTNHDIWSDLRSGTIITVAEDVPSDISYNPAAGDWWINVQASDKGDGLYIEKSSFPVSSSDWQLVIRNAVGGVVFGPAGEGVSPAGGIGGTEVFRLEADPNASVTRNSKDYDDGSDFSTFGAPNRWGVQDINDIRPKIEPAVASIALVSPNGGEAFAAGEIVTIQWTSDGIAETVLVEFSIDAGDTWSPVYPPNVGNTGQYKWLVPLVDTDLCLVRVSSSTRPSVYDVSDDPSAIVQILLVADLTGDYLVNFFDFALMASTWMQ
jgi:hypothetical protein